MNGDNDRTDHNRLATQMAERLREEFVESRVSQLAAFEKRASGVTRRKSKRAEPVETATMPINDIVPAAPQAAVNPVASGVETFNFEQNSPEWAMARMGIPTASAFSDVLAKGEGKTRRTYMLKLAGEIITGAPMENVTTMAMERGHALEAEARDLYALQTGATLTPGGFIRNGRKGCSPDSLIGDDGGLEIKTKFPHLLIETILKGEFPTEHKAQVQGTLWITGRQWWDIAIYWPGMPMFVKRTYRDEAYIQTLATEVDRFIGDLDALVAQLKSRVDTAFDFNVTWLPIGAAAAAVLDDGLPEFAAAAG